MKEAFIKALIAPLIALLMLTVSAIFVVVVMLSGITEQGDEEVYITPDGEELKPVVLDNLKKGRQ